jgi:hypothetical protein
MDTRGDDVGMFAWLIMEPVIETAQSMPTTNIELAALQSGTRNNGCP